MRTALGFPPRRATTPALGRDPERTASGAGRSDRIGNSDLGVTFQIYGHRPVGQDRDAAELIAKLIREALDRAPLE